MTETDYWIVIGAINVVTLLLCLIGLLYIETKRLKWRIDLLEERLDRAAKEAERSRRTGPPDWPGRKAS